MSDVIIALFIVVFLVGLALVAPIWGVDSRDGVESDQSSRRADWLYDRPARQPERSSRATVRIFPPPIHAGAQFGKLVSNVTVRPS